MSKYQMQDVDCIAWRDVFLPVQLAIAQTLKLIYLWAHEMATVKNIRRECGIQLSVYPDRLVFMRFVGIFRFFPLSARKRSWKFGFIAVK